MNTETIGFIGAGNMAEAIIKGIDGSGLVPAANIGVCDISPQRLEHFAALGHQTFSDAGDCSKFAQYLFLSVKPQQIDDVLDALSSQVHDDMVVVSIAAGITAPYIRQRLGRPQLQVKPVMPNTPLLIGEGAVAIGRGPQTAPQALQFVGDIFAASGKVWYIDEDKLNEIIPANGSSPAFIYFYTKLFCDCLHQQYGIDREMAKEMFCQTLIGSAKMMLAPGADIDDLIAKVCSKGGTTIAGIDGFVEKGMPQAVEHGIKACVDRAYELGKK